MSQQLTRSSEAPVHARFTKRLRVLACICTIVVSVPLLFSFLQVLNVYVILGESMVPTLNPGDLFFTAPRTTDIQEGTVIVFRSPFNDLVVHRVVDRVVMSDGLYYVTKGDANDQTDSYLVPEDAVLGFPSFIIPKLGFYFLIPRELALISMMGLILAYTSISYTISQTDIDAVPQPHWLISTIMRTKHKILTSLPFTTHEGGATDASESPLDAVPVTTLQAPERLPLPEHPTPTSPHVIPPADPVAPPIIRVPTKRRRIQRKRRAVESQVEDARERITTITKSQVQPSLETAVDSEEHMEPAGRFIRAPRVQRPRSSIRVQRRPVNLRRFSHDDASVESPIPTDEDASRPIIRVQRRPIIRVKRRAVETQVQEELAKITAAVKSQASLDDADAEPATPSVRIARVTRSSHIPRIHPKDHTPQRRLHEHDTPSEPTTRHIPLVSDPSAPITDIASLRERLVKEKTTLTADEVQKILNVLEQASARRPRDWIVRRPRSSHKRRRSKTN